MEANKILTASLLDLVFDTRNKDYGAYELRKTYQKRITVSLLISGGLVVLVLVGSVFARSLDDNSQNNFKSTSVVLQELPPEEEQPKVKPPEKLPEPEPARTEKLTTFKITEDDKVEEPPPTQDDLADAKIDLVKQDGAADVGIVTPDAIDQGTGIIEAKKVVEPEIWEKVEVEAMFPGGIKKWLQFLERNLNGNTPAENGAPAGRHTVVVRFIVDENGEVSNLVPLTKLGYGMEEEAMKVIKKAAAMKWTPANQNGRAVKAYRSQPITFVVETE